MTAAIIEARAPAARLQRETFRTSRLLEFCSLKELVAQTGHQVEDWPAVILKELVDNATDACEEAGTAPEITVSVSTDTGVISIVDNGPGIPTDTITGILDYSVRVSSREAYCSPSRGAQGNALKTLIAMAFALSGERGETVIEAQGLIHRIVFQVDHVRQEPRIVHEVSTASSGRNGTAIEVRWPQSASSILVAAHHRFLQILGDYRWLNPHLAVRLRWDNRLLLEAVPTDAEWQKWAPSDPTSAHWYDLARFERYVSAHVARDQDLGHDRKVREFIAEFRGFSGSAKQKAVLEETDTARVSLSAMFGDDGQIRHDLAGRLLESLRRNSRPVKPRDLGTIGRDHLFNCLRENGGRQETLKYHASFGDDDGPPWAVETGFGWCPGGNQDIVLGINWSVALGSPFRSLNGSFGPSLDTILTRQRAGIDEPIVLVLHFACPRVDYTDRGKTAAVIPTSAGKAIIAGVEAVTKEWARQRKAEERHRHAEMAREDRLVRVRSVTIQQAAYYFLAEAYAKASGDGKLPAKARQVMYAARPKILAATGRDTLNDAYFTQRLLPDFIEEHPEICASWDIVWDARGHLVEPHTGQIVPLGTIEVRRYLALCNVEPSKAALLALAIDRRFTTSGPRNRYNNILFIEKEGFDQILARARIQERFDITLMSTKGMSVTAARMLIDQLADVVQNVFVLHDLDISGFSICGTLGRDSRRYRFANQVNLIDLGLRLADVERMGLESEPVQVPDPREWLKRGFTLRRHGATGDEIEFLRRRRVELNAMTSPQLVAFIEQAFQDHGVEKFIPEPKVIEQHARHLLAQRDLADLVKQQSKEIAARVASAKLPDDLGNRVRELLLTRPEVPWDEAVAIVMTDGAAGDDP